MSLEKAVLRRRQGKGVFENAVRFGETFLDVAAVELEMRADVSPFHRLDFGEVGETGSRQLDGIMH